MRTARRCAVPHTIDECLHMLDAHADRECLRLHMDISCLQHRIGVACRVPNAQKYGGDGNALRIVHHDRSKLPRVQLHARHLRTKAHRPAHALDLRTQILHHTPQNVRTNVRLLQITDLLGRTRRNKCLNNLAHARIMRARRQLPIRKRPCAALAELHIRGRIKYTRPPKARDIRRAPIHILSALQDKRCKPRARQHPCGEDSRRPEPHHHGAICGRTSNGGDHHRHIFLRGCNILVPPKLRQHSVLLFKCNIQHIDPDNRRTVPAPRVQCLMNNKHPVHSTG